MKDFNQLNEKLNCKNCGYIITLKDVQKRHVGRKAKRLSEKNSFVKKMQKGTPAENTSSQRKQVVRGLNLSQERFENAWHELSGHRGKTQI